MADLTVNEALLDRTIRHATLVEGFAESEVMAIQRFIDTEVVPDLEANITRRLARVKSRGVDVTVTKQKQLRDMMQTTNVLLREGVGEAKKRSRAVMQEFAVSEARFQRAMLKTVWPYEASFALPHLPLLRSIVADRPVEGISFGQRWDDASIRTRTRITRAINIGLAQGEGADQIVRRLSGTRANGFRDGVWRALRRESSFIVRTTTTHVAAQATNEVAKANADVVKKMKWISTLDARTTDICASLDGQSWDLDDNYPQPPAHGQCRSRIVMVTKSWKELGIDLKEIPPPTRFARNYKDVRTALRGEVPGDTTYGQWWKKQPIDVQDRILGPGRAAVMRRGKVPFERLVDPRLRPLTLKQLEALERQLQ